MKHSDSAALKQDVRAIWTQVLDEPCGLRVVTDDPDRLQALLYETRRESGDARLLGFYMQKKEDGVWIMRRANVPEIKTNGGYRPLEED